MENIKEIILPDGWVIDKVENSKIILKEDDSKPVIKWNNEKNGVEVKADGYHFIVASMPTNIRSDYDSAKIICEKWGGYLPSVEELQVMCKYIKITWPKLADTCKCSIPRDSGIYAPTCMQPSSRFKNYILNSDLRAKLLEIVKDDGGDSRETVLYDELLNI